MIKNDKLETIFFFSKKEAKIIIFFIHLFFKAEWFAFIVIVFFPVG